MGTPASSALRASDAAQAAALQGAGSDPYGSLTGLGGPRKFKKKPVLVLDPEELERAHQLFQEGAAELVGGEYERPARPATGLLGLAAMDDEDAAPEDMGQTDDDLDGGDDEAIPTADDLMRMTGSRAEEDEEEQAYAMQMLEQGFDEDHRIFPALPVRPEEEIAAEEATQAVARPQPAAEVPPAPEPPAAPPPTAYKPLDLTPGFASLDDEDEEEDEGASWEGFAALTPEIRRETPVRPAETEEPAATMPAAELPAQAEPEPEPEPEPQAAAPAEFAPRIEEAPEDGAVSPYVGPFEQIRAATDQRSPVEPEAAEPALPESQPEPPVVQSERPAPIEPVAPVSYDFVPQDAEPAPAPEADVAPLDLASTEEEMLPPDELAPLPRHEPQLELEPEAEPQDWQADDAPEALLPEQQYEPEQAARPATLGDDWDEFDDGSLPEEAFADDYAEDDFAQDETSYTDIEDEPVDGYAFMYSQSQRGRALRSAAPGEANSLRARLVREREDEFEQPGKPRSNGSIASRFASWLRGLFG